MEAMHVPEGVMSLSVAPSKPKTEKAFQDALLRFSKEDPSFTYFYDDEASEFIISGMGELHLEIYCQVRLHNHDMSMKCFSVWKGNITAMLLLASLSSNSVSALLKINHSNTNTSGNPVVAVSTEKQRVRCDLTQMI